MYVARELQVQTVYNCSWPGNSIDSVCHTLISDSNQYCWSTDFLLVGIPPLARLTVVGPHDRAYHRFVYDINSTQIDTEMLLCHHGLQNLSFYDDETSIRFEDQTWTEIQACRTIFLLNQWLDRNSANYFILNLSKDFMTDHAATGELVRNHCFGHNRNILAGDTYYNVNLGKNKPADFDRYGWNGHHGAAGNKHFFETSLLSRLKNNHFI